MKNFRLIVFISSVLFCISPLSSPPLGLLLGLLLSQTIGHPFLKQNSRLTKILLQLSVIGLGFGMNLFEAAKAGKEGFLFTICSISITLAGGLILGKLLKIDQKISYLLSAGTAICGGSAIAAVGPIIDAKEEQMSVALGTVFILNALALFIFPMIGSDLGLSQYKFGMWAAIAIHDTSSVVGAAQKYGPQALQVAATVKLERALWIIPLSFVTALVFKNKKSPVHIPYFIFIFIAAMTLNTFLPFLHPANEMIVMAAKKGMTITLFLIGAGLSRTALRTVGFKPLLLGIILWVFISAGSLFVIETVI